MYVKNCTMSGIGAFLTAAMSLIVSPDIVRNVVKLYQSYYDVYEKYEKVQDRHADQLNTYIGYKLPISYYNKIMNGIVIAFALYWYYYEEFMFRVMCIIGLYLTFVVVAECAVLYRVYDGNKTKTENFNMYIKCREPLADLYAKHIHFILAVPLTIFVAIVYGGFVLGDAGASCLMHVNNVYYMNKSLNAVEDKLNDEHSDSEEAKLLLEEQASDTRIRNAVEQANIDNVVDDELLTAVHEALKDVPAQ